MNTNTLTQVEKINNNTKLVKLLMISEIGKAIQKDSEFMKKTFSHSLLKADFFGKADENYKGIEVKELFTELNIKFADKYEYFTAMYGIGKSQTALLISISKLDKAIIEQYLQVDNNPTLKGLSKFAKGESEETTNVTSEGITEKTETAKPKKLQTASKHIEAKIHEGADKNEAIELIKELMKVYAILPEELITENTAVAMAC